MGDDGRGRTIPEAFREMAAARREAVALQLGAETLTYAQLDRRSDEIAAALVQAGVAPESAVGVALPRSFDLVAATIGVLKACAVYVPLDLEYPAERLDLMAQEAQLAVREVRDLDRTVVRQRVLERFTVGRMVDGYEAVYRRLAAGSGSDQPSPAPMAAAG